MSNRILITPEQLDQVSSQFSQSGQQSREIVRRLESSMMGMEGQWEGMTRERFYGDYQQARMTMNKFVECLHSVSTELKQISVKFRTTDQSSSGNVMGPGMMAASAAATAGGIGGMAAGAAAAASGGTGASAAAMRSTSAAASTSDDKSIIDKMIDGVSVEGSVIEEREGGWYGKVLTGNAEAGLTSGASAGGAVIEAGYENEHVQGSVSLIDAELGAQVKDGNLEVAAEATLNKYEGGVNIPLPWTDKELHLGGSASLGVAGGSAEIGKDGVKFHLPLGPGVSLFGLGGGVSVK
ncbi:WXG100 family type VII secretion target [Paenibacillus lemnae]|uniref:WXG100 family type VII secretion target n=1 Tax=Paenibacillus lemnae TaxID=1330551 RepID=A0A848M9T5_PAELE|nr:WXG100 family type VII secretion target [Paenibacillus lemnae]NMO97807.1 WXG100 family type VII secretion target [Paenibacillus lemnae]